VQFSIKELQNLSILKNLPAKLLSWLINKGKRVDLSIDEFMFDKGQPSDFMFIIVSGKIQRYEKIANQLVVADVYTKGQVTGMLPYSRMTHYPGPALAKEISEVLKIDKKDFAEMLSLSEIFGQRLIAEMSNRVRGGVRMEQQLEKMTSLGRLSAGLAHEVNNPASAIHRTASILKEVFAKQIENSSRLARSNINVKEISVIEDFIQVIKNIEKVHFTPLQRNELEDSFYEFFESNKIKDASDLSRIFVESGIDLGHIENFAKRFNKEVINEVFSLIANNLEINTMLTEIINSSKGISELVSSVKFYSHMDQSLEYKEVDVRVGIDNTLRMLDYKIKQKAIQLRKNYQENLQSIQGNAGQLNQVWTNVLDNAIDAVDKKGQIDIDVRDTTLGIEIKIIDNGIGIPDEIHDRIFDAFFTTKDIGKGTGLGLDIAQRIIKAHSGQIEGRSEEGQTEIFIFLPFQTN